MLYRKIPPLSKFCLFALAGLLAVSASAADWINDEGGAFDVGSNWDPGVPGLTDNANFNLDGETYTVTFEDVSPTNNRLRVDHGNVTFDLKGQTYTLTDSETGHNNLVSVSIGAISGSSPTFTVLDGTLASVQTKIGRDNRDDGKATAILGAGGIWTHTHDFLVGGRGGFGELTIQDGGIVTGGDTGLRRVFIGHRGGTGIVNVVGAGSTLAQIGSSSPGLSIGSAGGLASGLGPAGTLNVSAGGTVTNNGTAAIGTAADSRPSFATVTGEDSSWTSDTGISVGNSLTEGPKSGTLMVHDQGEVTITSGDVTVNLNGLLGGNGGTVTASAVVNNGTVAPGNSTGTLFVVGNYTQNASGTFEANIGGSGIGDFGRLSVSGNVTLDGGLDVAMVNDYELETFQHFQILTTSGSLSGTFDGLAEGALVGTFNDLGLFITYDPDGLFGTGVDGVALYSIPEPAHAAVVLVIVSAVVVLIRRRRA